MENTEYTCKGFEIENAKQAREHMKLSLIRDYGDSWNGHHLYTLDEGKRYLARCENCGGLILVQQSEFHGSEDIYCLDFFPVSSAKEAEELNNTLNGDEIGEKFGKRYLMTTDLRASWSE